MGERVECAGESLGFGGRACCPRRGEVCAGAAIRHESPSSSKEVLSCKTACSQTVSGLPISAEQSSRFLSAHATPQSTPVVSISFCLAKAC
eukprot:311789-Rhodomonas_salina.4